MKPFQVHRNTHHFFGVTEPPLLPLYRLDDRIQDWPYFHFHPNSGAYFRQVENGLYGLAIERLDNGIISPTLGHAQRTWASLLQLSFCSIRPILEFRGIEAAWKTASLLPMAGSPILLSRDQDPFPDP